MKLFLFLFVFSSESTLDEVKGTTFFKLTKKHLFF